jgi:ADP-ribosylglycohydrolase
MQTRFVANDLDRDEMRAVGTLLCAVIGDALGSNCEFKSFEQIESQFGVVRNFVHSSWRPKGMFTDDGESTLALLDAILDVDCDVLSDRFEMACVRRYGEAFASPPRRGYGPTASAILDKLHRGEVTPDKSGTMFFASGSYANGCLMRISSLGVVAALRDLNATQVDDAVNACTRCTHSNVEALEVSAVYVRLLQRLFKLDSPPATMHEMRDLLRSVTDTASNDYFLGKLTTFFGALDAVLALNERADVSREELRAADKAFLTSFVSECEFGELFAIRAVDAFLVASFALTLSISLGPEEALIRVVNFGGDADTVGCICGAMLGALFGAQFVPDRWLEDLEDRDRIIERSIQLVRKIKSRE